MDSEQKKPGGGSGGGPDNPPTLIDHSDRAYIHGEFERSAIKNATLMSTQDDAGESQASLIAVGEHGTANVEGQIMVSIVAGLVDEKHFQQEPGVQVFCVDGAEQVILLQRGPFDFMGSKRVRLDEDGITIDAGVNGTLELRAGHSVITLSADGISIKGTLITIN
jgi:hypothetical protein